MESIFDILRRKEAQLATLAEEVNKLRAAAEIVVREQGNSSETPSEKGVEAQLAAAVGNTRSLPSNPSLIRKIMP